MLAWFRNSAFTLSVDWSALVLRFVFGGLMLINHGWPKLQSFDEKSAEFYNFLGLGAPISLGLTVFAEVFCSLLLVLGLGLRLALVPLLIMMLVILLDVHWSDPLGDKETPLLYLASYVALFLLGSGRFSLDAILARRGTAAQP